MTSRDKDPVWEAFQNARREKPVRLSEEMRVARACGIAAVKNRDFVRLCAAGLHRLDHKNRRCDLCEAEKKS